MADCEHRVFHIENERRGPILGLQVVNVALDCGAHDHEAVLHAHVDNSVSEVDIFGYLVEEVSDNDLVVLVEGGLDVTPGKLSIDDLAEGY